MKNALVCALLAFTYLIGGFGIRADDTKAKRYTLKLLALNDKGRAERETVPAEIRQKDGKPELTVIDHTDRFSCVAKVEGNAYNWRVGYGDGMLELMGKRQDQGVYAGKAIFEGEGEKITGSFRLIPCVELDGLPDDMTRKELVKVYIRALDSNPPADQKLLVKYLGRFGADAAPAVPALVRLMMLSKGDAAQAVINALGSIGPDAAPAIPHLVQILCKNDDVDLSYSASLALGSIGKGAIPHLRPFALGDDHDSRKWAFSGLREIGEDSLPLLHEAVTSNNLGVRNAAVPTFLKVEQDFKKKLPIIKNLLETVGRDYSSLRERVLVDITRHGRVIPELEPAVARVYADTDSNSRDEAMAAWAVITPQSVAMLRAARARLDAYPGRRKLVETLVKLDPRPAWLVGDLIKILVSPKTAKREEMGIFSRPRPTPTDAKKAKKLTFFTRRMPVADALKELRPFPLKALMKAYANGSTQAKLNIACILTQVTGRVISDVPQELVEDLASKTPELQMAAALAILSIKPDYSDAMPHVINALNSEVGGLQAATYKMLPALELAASKGLVAPVAKKLASMKGSYYKRNLIDFLLRQGKHEVLCKHYLETWQRARGSQKRYAAEDLARHKETAKTALPILVKMLRGGDHSVIPILEKMGPIAAIAVPELKQIARQKGIRSFDAASAICTIRGNAEAAPLLSDMLRDTKSNSPSRIKVIKKLARMGDEAKSSVSEIAKLVASEDMRLSYEACVALQEIGQQSVEVKAALAKAGANSRNRMNWAARRALLTLYPADPEIVAAHLRYINAAGNKIRYGDLAAVGDVKCLRGKVYDCLLKRSLDSNSSARLEIINSMTKLDPDRAAKFLCRWFKRRITQTGVLSSKYSYESWIRQLGTKADVLQPVFLEALANAGPELKLEIIDLLGEFRQLKSDFLPYITAMVDTATNKPRHRAIEAAVRIGPAAKSLVTALEKAKLSDDSYTRAIATVALFEIGHEPGEQMKWLKAAFEDERKRPVRFISVIGMLGPEAEALIPYLEKYREEATYDYKRDEIDAALRSIRGAPRKQ